MRPMLTISAVVLLHLGIIAVLVGVNGCRTTTGYEKDGDLSAYVGVAGATAASSSSATSLGGYNEAPKAIATTKPAGNVALNVGKGGTHTVVANESLWVIARREGVSIDAICAANNIEQNTVLRVGQKIVIPDGSTPVPARKTTAAKPKTSSTAPAGPALPSAPPGGFGGFGGVPAATPTAPEAPAPAPEAKKPVAPAADNSPLAAPPGGFGGFGGVPSTTTPTR